MLGLNVLTQTVGDRGRMAEYVRASGARAVVVMDDVRQAQELARARPALLVVHRAWRADDAELHLRERAADVITQAREAGRHGVVVQILNEPSGYGAQVTRLGQWTADAMRAASAAGIRIAVPNFAVGHPDPQAIARGSLDPMLRAFRDHPEHILAVHEYFQDLPEKEPQHIGRFRALLDRCRVLGVEPPIVVATEAGRDVGGGERDGWRDTGWTEYDYAVRLRHMARYYQANGMYAACVFGYGRGFGERWRSFDIEGAGSVLGHMQTQNAVGPAVGWMVTGAVRVRQLPSTHSPTLRVLVPGTRVRLMGQRWARGGWTWAELAEGGWIATEAARLR